MGKASKKKADPKRAAKSLDVTVLAVLPHEEAEARGLLEQARRRLMRRDRRLAAVIKALGPCGYGRRPGGFATLFHAILRQQLSGKAAATIAARLGALCGSVTPETVAALDDASFATAGVSRQKRDYLRGLATAALAAPELFTGLERLSDEAAIEALTAVKGIGRWTAEMYLMFSLGRLDVLPLGDVSIRAAIAEIYGIPRETKAAKLIELAEPWRPFRSVACWYFYAHLDRARARAGEP
jgi:DNA-3-methyladenine glycosylase II